MSINDVCKLALKIEKQLKKAKGNRYGVRDGYTRGGNSRPNLQSKVVKVDDKKTHRVEVSKLLVHLLLVANDALNAKD